MKRFLFAFATTCLFACGNSDNSPNEGADSTSMDPSSWDEVKFPDRGELRSKDQFYVWEIDPEQKTLKRNPLLQTPSLSVDTLIMGLNDRYPKVQLEKKHISNDTLYAEIKNADYLTDQMGSFGAEQYIAYAVLNLTSAPGIRFVRLDFAEGSHAAPDVWSRESFAAYKEVD